MVDNNDEVNEGETTETPESSSPDTGGTPAAAPPVPTPPVATPPAATPPVATPPAATPPAATPPAAAPPAAAPPAAAPPAAAPPAAAPPAAAPPAAAPPAAAPPAASAPSQNDDMDGILLGSDEQEVNLDDLVIEEPYGNADRNNISTVVIIFCLIAIVGGIFVVMTNDALRHDLDCFVNGEIVKCKYAAREAAEKERQEINRLTQNRYGAVTLAYKPATATITVTQLDFTESTDDFVKRMRGGEDNRNIGSPATKVLPIEVKGEDGKAKPLDPSDFARQQKSNSIFSEAGGGNLSGDYNATNPKHGKVEWDATKTTFTGATKESLLAFRKSTLLPKAKLPDDHFVKVVRTAGVENQWELEYWKKEFSVSSIPASGWGVVEMDANSTETMHTFAYKIEIQAEHHDPATVVIIHADHDHLDDDDARKQEIIKKTWEEGAGDEFLVEFGEILLTPRPEAFRDQYVMVQQKRNCRTDLEKNPEARKSEAFGPLEEDLERIISDAQFSMDQWNEIEAGLKANATMWPGVESEITAGPNCGCNPDFLNSETGCE